MLQFPIKIYSFELFTRASPGSSLVHDRFTFASDVRTEPLSRVVVEKAFGMGEPDCEVSGIAGVLEDRLEGEGDSVG